MWFYSLLLFTTCLFTYLYNRDQSELIRNILTFIIILVAILRYEVGYDYITYKELIQSEDNDMVNYLFSPLSALFAHIAIYYHSPQLLFILFGIPTYILTFSTFKRYSADYALSIMVFMAFFFYTSLSTIRQILAVAICLYGFRYITERKKIKYLICTILATLVHPSAIIAIFIYYIYHMRLAVLLGCFTIALILKPIAFHLMETYGFYTSYIDNSKDGITGGSLVRVIQLSLFLFCMLIWLRSKTDDSLSKGIINIILSGFLVNFMFTAHIGSRIALYFSIYICLLIANITAMTHGQLKKQLYFLFYSTCILYYFTYLLMPTIKGFPSSYIPYKLFFFQ